ncbi:hypothetical protein MTYM_00627 [Methylococcales bacterium]|nr:hypothetical protein MTYM_00627 [Methylococcales bacterium]
MTELKTAALKIGGYGIVLWIAAIYFSTALAIMLSAILVLLWLISGEFKALPTLLKQYPVATWSLLLFACFLIGLIYTDASHSDAIGMVKKYRELLFIPLLLPFLQAQKYRDMAWWTIIIASLITVIGSQFMSMDLFCVNLQCLPYFKSYITHGILVSFFAFLLCHKLFDSHDVWRWLYLSALLLAVYNLFMVSEGRTGQLVFLILMLVFAVQRFNKKGLLLTLLILSVLFAGFLSFSDKAARIKQGFATLESRLSGSTQGEYSMGERFTFWKNTVILIKEKPLLGQGTGNFTHAYLELTGKVAKNPHNEFLLITEQLGIIGLLIYLGFLFSQYRFSNHLENQDKWLMQGVFVSLTVTSLFNSPLLDHTEGHWFTTVLALCMAGNKKTVET